MMSGLRPIHSVETITCTSEMSGTASSGVRAIAHSPHTVSAAVPANTRNRLPAHHSMMRPITTGLLRRDRELLGPDLLATPLHGDGHVPVAGHHHLPGAGVG